MPKYYNNAIVVIYIVSRMCCWQKQWINFLMWRKNVFSIDSGFWQLSAPILNGSSPSNRSNYEVIVSLSCDNWQFVLFAILEKNIFIKKDFYSIFAFFFQDFWGDIKQIMGGKQNRTKNNVRVSNLAYKIFSYFTV